jgi:hypothetical protein
MVDSRLASTSFNAASSSVDIRRQPAGTAPETG